MYVFLYKASEIAKKILDIIIIGLILVFLAFGLYSIYDMQSLYKEAETPDQIMQYKPIINDSGNGDGKQDNKMSFDELQKINPDVFAWITINDTKIDYPVVISEDNVDYLNTDVMGEFSLSGSIFLDYRNQSDFSDSVSIIYGHNMNDKAMFGEVPPFADSEIFNSHTDGTLFTPNATYQLKIMAYVEVLECTQEIYSIALINDAPVENYVSYIAENAIQFRSLDEYPGDRYLTLSTCSSTVTDGRCLLILKIIDNTEQQQPPSES